MIIHLSHNDLDGITSILLSRQFNIKHYYPCSYDKNSKSYILTMIDYFISKYKSKITNFIITDINFSKDMLLYLDNTMQMINPSYKCLYIDHHNGMFTEDIMSKPNYTFVIDDNHSATRLYSDLLATIDKNRIAAYTDLITAVDAWDMWRFDESSFALDIQRVFYYYVFDRSGLESFQERLYSIIRLFEKDPPTNDYKPRWYNKYLSMYYTIHQYQIDKVIKNIYNDSNIYHLEFFNELKHVPAFEIEAYLRQNNPDIKYFIFVFDVNSNHIKIALRTNNSNTSKDMSEIAGRYGGGGHKKAASFIIPKVDYYSILNRIMKELASSDA